MSPRVMLMPQLETLPKSDANSKHFISQKDFESYQRNHGASTSAVKLEGVPEGVKSLSENKGDTGTYKAPHGPSSHLLHSIPPRAPHRSSRSNILSYTLYLATTCRLSNYSTPTGSASLLQRAEVNDPLGPREDEDWIEQEAKSVGLRKLSLSLLSASRKEGSLPLSLERRVALACLTEELLVSPLPDNVASPNSTSTTSIRKSAEITSLIALSPLTSPDQSTLFYDPAAAAASATSSIAQSLIDMKFSNSTEDNFSAKFSDAKFLSREAESVFGIGNTRSQLTAAPHMDYRIVRGHEMKSRAKEIFSESVLPTQATSWCRRHRVNGCGICGAVSIDKSKKMRKNLPGQGLNGNGVGMKKPLVELIPTFLTFSATLLKDLQERATISDESDLGSLYTNNISASPGSTVDGTAAWYFLLHSFAIQACLEGYLVDGWTGTEGIEILFGCGCGVWEGKGWASRVALANAAAALNKNDMELESSDSESDSEDDEAIEIERLKVREKADLIRSAECLFSSRDESQAEFERSMRDRSHEFLNVPRDSTLITHLRTLNAKYPLSSFEREMVDFLESASKLLGRPALARYEPLVTPQGQIPISDPDPYALTRFFTRSVFPEPEQRRPHRAWEDEGEGKRRRVL